MNRLPRNGANLLRMRRNGMRPDGLVLVSLVGSLGYCNYTLHCDTGTTCDWSMLADLEVELVASTRVLLCDVLRALAEIAAAVPASISLYYLEGARVDCGRSRFIPESINRNAGRMLFDWWPLQVNDPAKIMTPDSTRLAQRLWRELGGALPTPCDAALHRLNMMLKKEVRRGANDSGQY
jgi:hypothetical protein